MPSSPADRSVLVPFLAGAQALLLACAGYVLVDGDKRVLRAQAAVVGPRPAVVVPAPLTLEAADAAMDRASRAVERASRTRPDPEPQRQAPVTQQRTSVPPDPDVAKLSWPLYGAITSPFGPRGEGFHHGVDIGCAKGWPVRAARKGTVVALGDGGAYGYAMLVEHGDGYMTLYAHLDTFAVAYRDEVSRGEVIGTCGNTGRSTGPHLHFEVRYGGYVWNPLEFLS